MPKPPPVDYFELKVGRVPKEMLGEAMAALTRLGLDEVHFNLISDIPAFSKRTNHATTGETFLAEWIKDHPTFRSAEAVKAFKEDGRNGSAAYYALRVLKDNGVLVSPTGGAYRRADVKPIAPPKKRAAQNTYDIKNHELILRQARRSHGRFSTESARRLFAAEGRPVTSIGPSINRLLKAKLAKRVGDGSYALIEKAVKKPANKVAMPTEETADG
jgi:hypothetical protein